MAEIEEIDHTGDVGLIIRAGSLTELFSASAHAMFAVIADLENVAPQKRVPILLQEADPEALFVSWLTELNYIHIVRELLFCEFEIRDISETSLQAEARGEPVDADRHLVHTEIKAVTWHDLHVVNTASGWEAKVIFDM